MDEKVSKLSVIKPECAKSQHDKMIDDSIAKSRNETTQTLGVVSTLSKIDKVCRGGDGYKKLSVW